MAVATNYRKQLAEWAKRRAEMAKLQAAGWTLTEIGARYGISRQRVHQMLGTSGPTNGNRKADEA